MLVLLRLVLHAHACFACVVDGVALWQAAHRLIVEASTSQDLSECCQREFRVLAVCALASPCSPLLCMCLIVCLFHITAALVGAR